MYAIPDWQEPTLLATSFDEFRNYLTTCDNKYALKILIHQLPGNLVYQSILANDCYKIKLTRENKVEQIISYYIASFTNIWNSKDKFARGNRYFINIDIDRIKDAIQHIIHSDKLLDNLDIEFDEEHTYEQLLQTINLDDSRIQKLIPPTNYIFLKRVIEQEYDKYR